MSKEAIAIIRDHPVLVKLDGKLDALNKDKEEYENLLREKANKIWNEIEEYLVSEDLLPTAKEDALGIGNGVIYKHEDPKLKEGFSALAKALKEAIK